MLNLSWLGLRDGAPEQVSCQPVYWRATGRGGRRHRRENSFADAGGSVGTVGGAPSTKRSYSLGKSEFRTDSNAAVTSRSARALARTIASPWVILAAGDRWNGIWIRGNFLCCLEKKFSRGARAETSALGLRTRM